MTPGLMDGEPPPAHIAGPQRASTPAPARHAATADLPGTARPDLPCTDRPLRDPGAPRKAEAAPRLPSSTAHQSAPRTAHPAGGRSPTCLPPRGGSSFLTTDATRQQIPHSTPHTHLPAAVQGQVRDRAARFSSALGTQIPCLSSRSSVPGTWLSRLSTLGFLLSAVGVYAYQLSTPWQPGRHPACTADRTANGGHSAGYRSSRPPTSARQNSGSRPIPDSPLQVMSRVWHCGTYIISELVYLGNPESETHVLAVVGRFGAESSAGHCSNSS